MIKIGDHDHIRRQIILYSFNAAAARYFLPAALHTRRRRHSTLLIYWAVVVTLSPFLGIADSALLLSKLVPWQQHKMKMMKSINITKSIKKRGHFLNERITTTAGVVFCPVTKVPFLLAPLLLSSLNHVLSTVSRQVQKDNPRITVVMLHNSFTALMVDRECYVCVCCWARDRRNEFTMQQQQQQEYILR